MLARRLSPALAALALLAPARAAEADRYLPAETQQVVVVNVKQLLDSQLFKKFALPEVEKQLKDNKEYKEFQQATGVDVLKDVNSVVIGNAGTTGDNVSIIVRGRFDTDKIHQTARKYAEDNAGKLTIGKLGDRPLYEGTKDGKTTYITFIDATTMIASTAKGNLTSAVEGKVGRLNKDLSAALEKVEGRPSMWMVALIPEEAKKQLDKVQQGPVDALKKVKSASGSLNVTDSITASIGLSSDDEKAAKELADFATQMKGVVQFAAMGNEMLKPFADEFLRTLKIDTTRGDVSVSFKLSEDFIKKALDMIPRP